MVMAEWLRPFGLFRLEKKMNKKKLIRIVSIYSVISSNYIVKQRFVSL